MKKIIWIGLGIGSPTRAAMMSGKAPQRVGISQFIKPTEKTHLPLREVMLGEAFQQAGNQGFDWVRATNHRPPTFIRLKKARRMTRPMFPIWSPTRKATF